MRIFVVILSQKTFLLVNDSATTFIVHKYSFQRVPNQFEKLWNSRGWGGEGGLWQATPAIEIPEGWGSKAKVPSMGGMNIFWNFTLELMI